MKSDLYRLGQRYSVGSSRAKAMPQRDAGKTAYARGGNVSTDEGGDTETPSASFTPTEARRFEDLMRRYGTPSTNYGAQLATAQQAARSETEAFSNMIRQMSERAESPTSRAEMYFRLAAAFGSPTKTGQFTENLALAGRELGEYAKSRRAEEADRRNLGLRAQELRMSGARQDLASLQQLAGQESAERRAINSRLIEASIRANSPSARERRISDMMSTYSIDRQTASRIVDNVDTVVPDPVTGMPQVVDRITGQSRPANAPGATPAAAPAAPGAAPTATPGAAPTAQAPQQRSLYDLAQTPFTTGAGPAAAEGAQRVLGQVGLNVVPPEFTERRQTFLNVQNDVIKGIMNNPRFPVAEQERIRREINIEPSMLTDPQTLTARIRTLDNTLRSSLTNREREGADTSLPVTDRREALRAANDIRNLLTTLGVPQGREAAEPPRPQRPSSRGPRVGQVIDGYTFLGGDPSDRNNWSRE